MPITYTQFSNMEVLMLKTLKIAILTILCCTTTIFSGVVVSDNSLPRMKFNGGGGVGHWVWGNNDGHSFASAMTTDQKVSLSYICIDDHCDWALQYPEGGCDQSLEIIFVEDTEAMAFVECISETIATVKFVLDSIDKEFVQQRNHLTFYTIDHSPSARALLGAGITTPNTIIGTFSTLGMIEAVESSSSQTPAFWN